MKKPLKQEHSAPGGTPQNKSCATKPYAVTFVTQARELPLPKAQPKETHMGIGYVLSIVGIGIAGLVNSIARENQRKENALARMHSETNCCTHPRPSTPTRRVLHHEPANTRLHHHR